MPDTIWGPSLAPIAPSPGSYLIHSPAQSVPTRREDNDGDPLIEWCRNCRTVLLREREPITVEMQRAMNLYRGGTPWWSQRPRWKMGTRLNECFFVPTQWAAILSDNKPRVTYTAKRPQEQRIADIATAAFLQEYEDGGWHQRIRNTILLSRIQKKAFLRLTYDKRANNGEGGARLETISGEQVFVDRNAKTTDDAEVLMYETRLSLGEIVAQYPKIRGELTRKRSSNKRYSPDENGDIASPSTSMAFPANLTATAPFSANAPSVNNPPYAGQANGPDEDNGSGGLRVNEFWLRPHKTITIDKISFSASGEPETVPKKIKYADGTSEPMRRIITEGLTVYEIPASALDILQQAEQYGGIAVLHDDEAVEVVKVPTEYPLYPAGRLITIVDGDIKADDRMNPLGYIPFIEIDAYADGINFWGLSDIDVISDGYEYLSRLVSSLLDAAHLTSNPIWRLPLSSETSDDDITNAPGAIQREDIISLRYGKREAGPEMPHYVMQLIQYVDGKVQKLSGLNDIMMGGTKGKAQQSTDALTMQQENAGVRFRDAMHNVEQAMMKLGKQFLELMARNYNTPRVVQIKNRNGDPESVQLLGSHLVGDLRVEAKPGSAQPSPTARLNMLLNLLSNPKPVVDLTEVWQALQELGVIGSASALERRIEREMRNPATQWRVTMPSQQGGAPQKSQKKPGSRRAKSGVKA